MRNVIASVLLFLVAASHVTFAQTVYLRREPPDEETGYALEKLRETFAERGYSVVEFPGDHDFTVSLEIHADTVPEAFFITPGKERLDIAGGDKRGLIYGVSTPTSSTGTSW